MTPRKKQQGVHRDPVGVDEDAQRRDHGEAQGRDQRPPVRPLSGDQQGDDPDDGNEIIDKIEIGKDPEQGSPRVAGGRVADLPQKACPQHGQDDQGQVEKPGGREQEIPRPAGHPAPREMFGEQEPDVGQGDIDQVKKKIQQDEEAAVEGLSGIDDDPQAVHGDIEHAGADQDQRDREVFTLFQFLADIDQHQGQSQEQQRGGQRVCNCHLFPPLMSKRPAPGHPSEKLH